MTKSLTAAFHARACARPDKRKHSRSKRKRGVNKPEMVVQIQRKESTCSPTTPTRVHSIGVRLLAHILRQVSPQHPQVFWKRGQTSSTYPNQSHRLYLITCSREENKTKHFSIFSPALKWLQSLKAEPLSPVVGSRVTRPLEDILLNIYNRLSAETHTVTLFLNWRPHAHAKGQRPHRHVRVCFTCTSMV